MVSIIIPCYNSFNFLSRAIESVLGQTYSAWEIILVNNNSVDNTQEIIDQYVRMYPDKIFSLFEERKGACYARNTGLRVARGEWIQFLDADDKLLPSKFKRQVSLAEMKAQVVIGSFTRVYVAINKSEDFNVCPEMSIWQAILRSQAGITSANLYDRKAVLEVNGWNEKLSSSQEYDLLFRLLKSGATVTHDTVLSAQVFEELNSVSRPTGKNGRDQIVNNYVDLRLQIAAYLDKNNLWDERLRKIYAVSLYEMLLNKKDASIQKVHVAMKERNLETTGFSQFLQLSKFYIKRLIFRR